MQDLFGDDWEQANLEGVVVGRSDNNEIEVRWDGIDNPPIYRYKTNHTLWKDMPKTRVQKRRKMGEESQKAASVHRMNTEMELEIDEDVQWMGMGEENFEDVPPSADFQGDSVIVQGNEWKHNPALDGFDCCTGIPTYQYDAFLKWPQRLSADRPRSELDYWKLMVGEGILQHLVDVSKPQIYDENFILDEKILQKFIGVMYAMTINPG